VTLKATNRKQGFVYKARSPETAKARASRTNGNFVTIFKPGFDTFKAKQGDNLVRYLPPTWDDAEHYGYSVYIHRNVGPDSAPYVCPRKMLGKPCAVCEEVKVLKDAGEATEAKEIDLSERIVSWILDRDGDDPEKPVLWDQSWTQDRDITALCVNDRTGEILMIDHPDKGYDVSFKRTGTGMKKTKYYGWAIDRESTPVHDKERVQDEILDYIKDNPVPDTLQIFDYDYLKGVLSGTVAAKDEELDKEDDEPPFEGGNRRGSRTAEPEDTPRSRRTVREEEDTPQISRGGSRRQIPEQDEEVNEEVDEDTGEVIERSRARQNASPARSGARGRVVEPDEEDEPAPPRAASRRVR
jgi:hypothetical protein